MPTFTVHIRQYIDGHETYHRVEHHIGRFQLEQLHLTHPLEQGWAVDFKEESSLD